ncbi:hypothetical protein LP7551_02089 [Roseibium album]|nr:hypothetical protein LP7551_02089 [Roseibium album]
MSFRPTTHHDHLALKAAFRRLMRKCGGQDEAAEATRVSRHALSRYGNNAHCQEHVPVDVLMDLTIDADDPEVVRALCRLANGVFVPLPRARTSVTNWPAAVGAAVKRGADAAEAICSALNDEGQISPEEIYDQQILDKLSAAIEALVVLQGFARVVSEQEAAE